MTTRPDSKELLEVARHHLLETILPQLEGKARYEGLMVANAMAIAIRDLGSRQHAEIEAPPLEILYPGHRKWTAETVEAFCRDVKSGRFDHAGPERQAAEQALKVYAEAELDVANPKYRDTAPYD